MLCNFSETRFHTHSAGVLISVSQLPIVRFGIPKRSAISFCVSPAAFRASRYLFMLSPLNFKLCSVLFLVAFHVCFQKFKVCTRCHLVVKFFPDFVIHEVNRCFIVSVFNNPFCCHFLILSAGDNRPARYLLFKTF